LNLLTVISTFWGYIFDKLKAKVTEFVMIAFLKITWHQCQML